MSKENRRFYEFGAFRLDTINRCLRRNGEQVPLKAKAVETLLLLIERRGDVVEKDDLMGALWPDSFVEEANLTQNIYMLRKALGDGQYIETVPRRGYRFVAHVKEWEDVSPAVVLIKEKTSTSVTYEEEIENEPELNCNEINERLMTHSGDAKRLLSLRDTPSGAHANRARIWLGLSLMAAVLGILVLIFWPRNAKIRFANVKLTRFTTTGNALRAAISPDGKYIAYVADEPPRKSVWLRQVTTGRDLQIVPPEPIEWIYGLTFSHDGNYLYYVTQQMNHVAILYRVPSIGGPATSLLEDVDSPVTLSRDDNQLAFIRGSAGATSVIIANSDGSGTHGLFSSKRADSFNVGSTWTMPPAWSPDGKLIACQIGVTEPEGVYQTVWGIQTADGSVKSLTSERWDSLGRIDWVADGSGVIVTGAVRGSDSGKQVWLIDYPDGRVRQITNDLSDYGDLTVTGDGRTLVAIQVERKANVWLAALENPDSTRQITFTNYDGLAGLTWTPDGKLIYTVAAGAEQNLWLTDLTRTTRIQLTTHAGINQQPAVTPDGRYLVFVSNRTGFQHLWRMDLDGRHPQELTHGVGDVEPSFTPDGKWIIYRSVVSGRSHLFRISIDGGEPVTLQSSDESLRSGEIGNEASVSPDGKLIALVYRAEPDRPNKIAIMPIAGGEVRVLCDLPSHYGHLRWTTDGQAIAYADKQNGKGNIWLQPIDGGAARQSTHWKADPIFSFDWSRDGRWVAYATGMVTSDVVLITDANR